MPVRNHIAAFAAVLGCLMAGPARADHRPVIAVPGNPQVPVIIDGIDASYAVVSGNWGLYAPGAVVPEIYGPVVLVPVPGDRGYFPATGRRPRYGRQEIMRRARCCRARRDYYPRMVGRIPGRAR